MLPGYAAVADRILFDARAPKDATRPGGLGAVFDWHVLENLDLKLPFMVSGGLNAGNVAEAVRVTRAGGVDVSSGVERAPGVKDPEMIRAFIRAARATEELMSPMNLEPLPNSFRSGPDERGHFGIFGGRFVAETLMPLILDLEKAYADAKADPAFQAEMNGYLKHYVGRPSPLYFAERLTEHLGGAKIYFKREELNHTGSHKVNNVLGQIMLARRMGKKRIIAETGAGQHGVATATLCARFGLECVVYMGAVDVERQQPNVIRMKMLGAKVVPVQSGSRTLKDAMNEALRDWVTNVAQHVLLHRHGGRPASLSDDGARLPVGDRQRDPRADAGGRRPPAGFADRLHRRRLQRDGAVPSLPRRSRASRSSASRRRATASTQLHAASIAGGRPGVLHGNRTYLLMDEDGQIQDAHSISAGLDYPGIGPEHSWLHDTGRVTYLSATDDEALEAFQLLSRLEGIIPALEPAHAIAKVMELAPKRPKDHLMVVNLSGRGDKDMPQVGGHLEGQEEVTTRIDARFAELKKQGRAAFVTFLMAGDPDPATSLDILKALPKAGADIIEIGMPFTDPMADGPVDPGRGLARAESRHDPEEDARAWCARFRKGDDATPMVLMGYYNPIYIYGVDQFPRRCRIRRRRRPDHRRSAARRGRRTVPAGDAGRAQFHPAGDADHRRQAAARGAREYVGLCLLRLDHRHHRQRQRQYRRGRRGGRPDQAAHPIAGLRRLRHPDPGSRPRHRRECRRRGGRHRAGRCPGCQPRCPGPRDGENGDRGGRSRGCPGAGRAGSQTGCGISHNCGENRPSAAACRVTAGPPYIPVMRI